MASHQLRSGRQMQHQGCPLGQVFRDAVPRDQQETGVTSYETAALDDCRSGGETSFRGHRKADDDRRVQAGQCLRDRLSRLLRSIKQNRLLEKVSAGRAGDAHFREHDDVSAYGCRLAGKADDLLCILRRIRKPHPWRDGGNSQNSVFAHDVANICEIAQKCPG